MERISDQVIHKEIDLIQACILRMTSNSFFLKGWTISLVSVILAIFFKNKYTMAACIVVIFVIINFWCLDAVFFRTEEEYRKLYQWVLQERPKGNKDRLYDLDPKRFSSQVDCVFKLMFSKTLFWFYGVQLVLVAFLEIYFY